MLLFSVAFSEHKNEDQFTDNLEYIYTNYYAYAKYLLVKYLPECDTVEDIIQDIFLSLIESKTKFNIKDDIGIKNFFIVVCRNRAIDYAKKTSEKLSDEGISPIEFTPPDCRSAEEVVMEDEDVKILYDIICSLSENCRDICLLKYISGLSNVEIAESLGISENTVAKRLFKARREVRIRYEKQKKRL